MEQKKISYLRNRPLHSKYRPNNFSNVLGQEHLVSYFKRSILNKKIAFSYLFVGKHGVGKTTMSRIVAKALNCSSMYKYKLNEPCNECLSCLNVDLGKSFDVHEINAAMNTGIDNIRELIEKTHLSPVNSLYKVCIIDEIHMLSLNAFNALLKILEEPPKNVLFILITTDIKKIPGTIVSRSQKLCFLPISSKDLAISVSKIVWLEKGSITNKALLHILDSSEGSFRDAINIIDMLLTQNSKINQSACSFLLTDMPNSIPHSLLQHLLSKNIIRIVHIINYVEERQWSETNLIKHMKKILKEKIVDGSTHLTTNKYLVFIWQILLKYDSEFFLQERLSLFISELILLFSRTDSFSSINSINNKKTIPHVLKIQAVQIY